MARTYTHSPLRRLLNAAIRPLIRVGLGGPHTYLLTTVGRRSGRPTSTPVTLVEQDGARWLVAPYGVTGWVRNARAAGQVDLARRGRRETLAISELGAPESGPVLREYARRVRVTRPFFDALPDAPAEEFAAEAVRHPVFRLTAAS